MKLVLDDGSVFEGQALGSSRSVAGELVFNTGMVGYAETLTDPSYCGQILIFTYPLIGNYGVFSPEEAVAGLAKFFESAKIQVAGVVLSSGDMSYSHPQAVQGFDKWLKEHDIPAICGIDTRALTLKISQSGGMLAKLVNENEKIDFYDPNSENLVQKVSAAEPEFFDQKADKSVLLVDMGAKNNIIRYLLAKNVNVHLIPWDYDYRKLDFDGIVLSNGPGDPSFLSATTKILKTQFSKKKPIMGICLGHQIMALAAGAKTYKMKFGHRSQNQPCVEVGTKKIYITSQNHGFAVDESTLDAGWQPWFFNANDGSNEGIKHETKPFFSVQFHPEAAPGPVDTKFLFDRFVALL